MRSVVITRENDVCVGMCGLESIGGHHGDCVLLVPQPGDPMSHSSNGSYWTEGKGSPQTVLGIRRRIGLWYIHVYS